MSDIFISYAREDRPRAQSLAQTLEAQGWSTWWDWNIPAGKTFRQVIQEELEAARCVIVLWSARSVERKWVIEEAAEGEGRGILVPALIEKVRPPLGFREIQTADLIRWEGEAASPAFRKLCVDIGALIGAPTRAVRAAAAAGEDAAVPGRLHESDALQYVRIPPGEFWMGATPGDSQARTDEQPRHRVQITRGFCLGEAPVTVSEYHRFANETGRMMPDAPDFNIDWSKENHPIVNVTWDDAQAYCAWAGGRLPTEAEWEYVARGGKEGWKYPWGNEITPANANYGASKWQGTSPVRSYPPNSWGLYDMAGNVWEWVADWYAEKYHATVSPDKPAVDPRGPRAGKAPVLRGGSFVSSGWLLRAAVRDRGAPGDRLTYIGFRCAWETAP